MDIPPVKLERAFQTLELALHPNTCDGEALSAIYGFRRIAAGATLARVCERIYGGATIGVLMEEWEDRLAESNIEITRLRGELRRAKKALDDRSRAKSKAVMKDEIPSMTLPDDEWDAIEYVIPVCYRNEKLRDRISAIIVVLRTNCGWRVLDPDGGNKWTTYYNQYRTWQYEDWWGVMMKTLSERVSL